MSDRIETSLLPMDELVEVIPYGVTVGPDQSRPIMLFKEKKGKEIFPVWLSPLDAGIAISQHHVKMANVSPHDLTAKILKSLGVRVKKVVFKEIRGNHQYVDLFFEGSTELQEMRCRADQCISFCLHARCRFFCTRRYMAECRDQDAEITGVAKGLRIHPDMMENPHPYLM